MVEFNSKGEIILFYRRRLNISQVELAAKSGLSVSYLSQVERNRRDISDKSMNKIANIFNIEIVSSFNVFNKYPLKQ